MADSNTCGTMARKNTPTMWPTWHVCWLIDPIDPYGYHSYGSYVHQLSYRLGAQLCMFECVWHSLDTKRQSKDVTCQQLECCTWDRSWINNLPMICVKIGTWAISFCSIWWYISGGRTGQLNKTFTLRGCLSRQVNPSKCRSAESGFPLALFYVEICFSKFRLACNSRILELFMSHDTYRKQ